MNRHVIECACESDHCKNAVVIQWNSGRIELSTEYGGDVILDVGNIPKIQAALSKILEDIDRLVYPVELPIDN